MNIGFSGSRYDLTSKQLDSLRDMLGGLLCAIKVGERACFHHGDCLGGDAAAHDFAQTCGYFIIIHPPTDSLLRAFKQAPVILPPKPYLERNRDIVDASDRMLFCPNTMTEQTRSGTWSTYRYAKRQKRDCVLIMPDGGTILEVGASRLSR